SIMRMGELIARSRFVKEAVDANMGTLFHTSSFVSGTQRFTAPLTVSPGRTVYTLPEIAEALTQQQPSGSPIFTGYMKALGATKTAKTVLSPMTQARNFLANVGFLIGQGHL